MAKKKTSLKKVAAPTAEQVSNQTTTSSDASEAPQRALKEVVTVVEPATNQTTASSDGGEVAKKESREVAPMADVSSPEKTERLKQLNDILLKQAMEKREQVSQLQARLEHLGSDFLLASETERDVMKIVLSSLVVRLGLEINAKMKEAEDEKKRQAEKGRKLEARAEHLRGEVKAGVEKVQLVEKEKSEILIQLEEKKAEVLEMKRKVTKLEMGNSEMERRLLKVSEEKEELVKEGIKKEGLIGDLKTEKKELEGNLDDFQERVQQLETKVEEEVRDKVLQVGQLKTEKVALEAKIISLENEKASEVGRLISEVEGINRQKTEKEGEIRDLKAEIVRKDEKIVGLEKEVDILQLAIVEANKKLGFWSWFYPAATTILAALSYIYAARAR